MGAKRKPKRQKLDDPTSEATNAPNSSVSSFAGVSGNAAVPSNPRKRSTIQAKGSCSELPVNIKSTASKGKSLQSSTSSLHKELKSKDDEIERLRKKVLNLEETFQIHGMSKKSLAETIERQNYLAKQATRSMHHSQISEAKNNTQNQFQGIKEHLSHMANLENKDAVHQATLDELDRMKGHVKKMERDKIEERKKFMLMQASVRKLQKAAFDREGGGRWEPLQDSDIRHKLNSLEKAVKDWAKKHVVKSFNKIWERKLTKEEAKCIKTEWLQIGLSANIDQLIGSLNDANNEKLTLIMLTSAWAVRVLYNEVFKSPFTCVDEFLENEHRSTTSCAKGHSATPLWTALNTVQGKHSKEMSIWRAQTLRLLSPAANQEGPSRIARAGISLDAAMNRVSMRLASKFIASAQAFLVSPTSPLVKSQLGKIFNTGAEIAHMLWTQESRVALFLVPKLFSQADGELVAHPFHARKLDEDETCLDGEEILLVVHPLLKAIGLSDGSNNNTERVLKEATVWMGGGN